MEKQTKKQGELFYSKKNFFEIASQKEIEDCFSFADDYKNFLNKAKTERETCKTIVGYAKENGFSEYQIGDKLKVGDKKYFVNRDKCVILFKIGKNNLEKSGIRILGAHIDSPRIDLKPNPLYESDGNICLFKTHYYGGIKKYQWTTIPLALHGTVVKGDGSKVDISVGEEDDEPIFYISDLLPHLGQDQMKQTGDKIITGEQLNVVLGGIPSKNVDKNKIKYNILEILNNKYGIKEEDLLSSELCVVPALRARDVGLDRVFIAGYGHDDKSCAYPCVRAIIDSNGEDTVMACLVDKEEIGSVGNTSMNSRIFEDIINEICLNFNRNPRLVRANSKCLSADVTSCYDPNFKNVFDVSNVAFASCGTCLNKYGGRNGKSDSNDASAELVGELRKIFAENKVLWQTSELGKVDLGGGGTIAKFVANLNIDTIDIGVPVISMHAPYELISKADLYCTYKALVAFAK